ncbi:HD domain-containing protein [Parvibaculaceae bacterium PLY_AMNH_Bact1]|nr:HD domain-containing protein [Parvibaculaceae bacterium PLY_AMNH_Bact1]
MTLAQDPGRLAKPTIIRRILMSELRGARHRLALRLGLKRLHDAVPEDWQAPDSALARQARGYAEVLCSPMLVAHSERTYCFGALLAARDGLKLDKELFYLGCILHDLGLSDAHQDDPGSFEWVGAGLARTFCLNNGVPENKADLVHDAIAFHSSVGVVHKCAPELAFVHFGAGLDLLGSRLEDVPKTDLSAILERYSRDSFASEFGGCLHHQAACKPTSHIAGPVGIGFADRIKDRLA